MALPDLAQIIAVEESRLGIGDDNSALSPDEKDAILDAAYSGIATPIGEAVKAATDVPWIVENFVARGGLYVLAGNPKKSRKSLLALDLCLAIATGRPFLGLPVVQPVRTIFANFEDGDERCARRLRDYGVQPGSGAGVDLVTSRGGFPTLCTYIKRRMPPFVVLDPMIEIEMLLGCTDENKSDQMGKLLGDLRELVRSTRTAVVAPHHLSRERQNLRGSTALEGAIDGWFIVRQQTDGTLALECTNRDCQDMRVRFSIAFTDRGARVQAIGAPEIGPLPEYKAKSGSNGSKASAKANGPSDVEARGSLLLALLNSADGLGRDDRRVAARVSNSRLANIQDGLVRDGLIEQRGRKMLLTPKGTEEAGRYKEQVESSQPKGITDLIGSEDDDTQRRDADDGSDE